MLEAILAMITILAVISVLVVTIHSHKTIIKMHNETLKHFAATRPVGASTAALVEKEMDFNMKVHTDRTEDARRLRTYLENREDTTAEEVLRS